MLAWQHHPRDHLISVSLSRLLTPGANATCNLMLQFFLDLQSTSNAQNRGRVDNRSSKRKRDKACRTEEGPDCHNLQSVLGGIFLLSLHHRATYDCLREMSWIHLPFCSNEGRDAYTVFLELLHGVERVGASSGRVEMIGAPASDWLHAETIHRSQEPARSSAPLTAQAFQVFPVAHQN
jgi:hypothetical protein